MRSSTRSRNVLGGDGLSHGFAQALSAGIKSPDNALQFGKLLDQPGGEIGLGQAHGLLERFMVERDATAAERGGQSRGGAQVGFRLGEIAAQIL